LADIRADRDKATDNQQKLRFEHTVEAIQASKPNVINQANALQIPLGSDVVYEFLRKEIDIKLAQAKQVSPPNQADISKWSDASDVLKSRNPPSQLGLEDTKNRKEVLEALMASLQHLKIETLRMEGPDSPRIAGIDAAIKAASDYRSGMTYIRPPSAYLRTSFPATSLQSDPKLVWENMLEEQAIKGLPFARKYLNFFDSDGKRDAAVTADIDKQFWQNINRVRVAGAGLTNYAIAKDDIGNWYVKKYDSNPKPIIESAQALAMYNLGGSMKLNLLPPKKANGQSGESGGTGTKNDDPPSSNLGRVFGKYHTSYTDQTKEDKEQILTALGKGILKERISRALNDNDEIKRTAVADVLMAKLELVSSTELQPVQEALQKKAEDSELGGKIITALHGIKRFNAVLVSGFRNLRLTEDTQNKLSAAEEEKSQKAKELERVKLHRADMEDRRNKATEQTRDQTETDLKQAKALVEQAENELEIAQQKLKTAQETVAQRRQAVNAAIAESTRVTRGFLVDMIQRRDKISNDYETAILFIGEANKQ
jgi:hypothetical protein